MFVQGWPDDMINGKRTLHSTVPTWHQGDNDITVQAELLLHRRNRSSLRSEIPTKLRKQSSKPESEHDDEESESSPPKRSVAQEDIKVRYNSFASWMTDSFFVVQNFLSFSSTLSSI